MRVLIVEHEGDVTTALQEGLQADEYQLVVERTVESGYFRASTETFELILLDLALPGRDGFEILAAIRRRSLVPIIVVTSRGTVPDRVRGLDDGADDYLVKPFASAELLARVRSLLRRRRSNESRQMSYGALCMDLIRRQVTIAGTPVDLTAREFDVLECLMRADGRVVSRTALVQELWMAADRTPPLDNVVDVHISRVRRKLARTAVSPIIHTVRGVGFALREADFTELIPRSGSSA